MWNYSGDRKGTLTAAQDPEDGISDVEDMETAVTTLLMLKFLFTCHIQ